MVANILVTGGCGFIGSHFLNNMVIKYPQYNFINLDCMYYCANIKNIKISQFPNYKYIEGNLTSFDLVKYVLLENNIDIIIHFAAQSHVDNSFSNPLQYTLDNVVGTHNLLEASRIYGKINKFIHVSTDEVYGESSLDDMIKKNEMEVLCPTNPYAATKAAAELICRSYLKSFKLPILITRGNNVYGEHQYPEKLIPKFIYLLKNGKKCTIQGDGSNVRSYIYINDVVNAFDIILHKGDIGEIYNIGSTEEYNVSAIAKLLIKKIKNT